jgi:hypothetical protein
MPPTELLRVLQVRPFRPIRLVMTDGTVYEVRHPDMVMVELMGAAYVGYPDPSHRGAVTRVDIVALSHVARLEFIDQVAPAPRQGDGQGE